MLAERQKTAKIDPLLESQFQAGRLYASISSRPGQSGRADGYVLEGKELEVSRLFVRGRLQGPALMLLPSQFYVKRLRASKSKHAA